MATATKTTTTSQPDKADLINRFDDRCDRCGAEAYFIASRKYGRKTLKLFFCGHHSKFHRAALDNKKWTVVDFTYMLNASTISPEEDG